MFQLASYDLKGINLDLPDWVLGSVIEAKVKNGNYEAKEAEAARKRLRPGMRVLEIGAGLGYVTAVCAAHAGPENIVSVEPNPRMLDPIRYNLSLNNAEKVTLLHGAVVPDGTDESSVPFFPGKLFWGGSMDVTGRKPDEVIQVPAFRLGDLLEKYRPRFVIMDIEGAEQLLFEAPWPRFVRFVVLELHPARYEESVISKIVDCMAQSGLTYDPFTSNGKTIGFKRFRPGPKKTAP